MTRILVATHNPGKLREYAELLADLNLHWLTLDDAGITFEVEETGTTFEENARLKAVEYARSSGMLTLADDSGLEVEALGGEPGVYSARYGGNGYDDIGRYRLVLEKLAATPAPRRQARFRCVIAICTPTGDVHTAAGSVEGLIADGPRGSNGFGYDPIFFVEDYGRTMAELPPETKNRISHRARAIQAIHETLAALVGQ
ncbi:MAG: XTP/dITP diphosphatase [Anaerolineae bacterium]|nr:XTP/dITP diphosphatase [Anaerolineae bacterium]